MRPAKPVNSHIIRLGDLFSVIDILCGGLICVECRYPELYRAYKRLGAQLIFHSFNSAHVSDESWSAIESEIGHENYVLNPATTFPGITQPAMMHAAAGSNHMWISCSNSSAPRNCWPSFFLRPDGVIIGRLRSDVPGVLFSVVDTDATHYGSTADWRDRAMNGMLNSGELVVDPCSQEHTAV